MNIKKSKQNGQSLVIIILLILLTAVTVGAGIYLWQQAKINSLQKAVRNQIQYNQSLIKPSPTTYLTSSSPVITTPVPTTTTLPTTIAKSDLLLIKEAFATKYSKPIEDVNVTISKNTGTYASGGVSFSGEIGGAMWFAAKEASNWVIVFDGNGTPICSNFSSYDFPDEIINECWDESTSSMRPL